MSDAAIEAIAVSESTSLTGRQKSALKLLQKKYGEIARKKSFPSFELSIPPGHAIRFGNEDPAFRVVVRSAKGWKAIASMDETSLAVAYLDGNLDFEGDIMEIFHMRTILTDNHPLSRIWFTYIHPWIFGQVKSDSKWIAEHYDEDEDFYLSFLDPTRVYSQGVFLDPEEPLEVAMRRKMDFALEMTGLRAGQRVLDIGGGWGAFNEYAGKRGIRVTSLTISKASEEFLTKLIRDKNLPCEVKRVHLFEYEDTEKFDAIVNMGVTEHLPDYAASLRQYERLLKPGGRVYLDASASREKFGSCSFVYRYIYPGNATTLSLHDYLAEVARSPFELMGVWNDRESYMLTSLKWAENLERNRAGVVERHGERLYRKFMLFHLGCAYTFREDILTAYRWVLELSNGEQKGMRLNGKKF